jgi:potassium-transporting ATPase KdpC subunit
VVSSGGNSDRDDSRFDSLERLHGANHGRQVPAPADPATVRKEIEQILQSHAWATLGGLAGEQMINVLQVNLELRQRYGAPK